VRDFATVIDCLTDDLKMVSYEYMVEKTPSALTPGADVLHQIVVAGSYIQYREDHDSRQAHTTDDRSFTAFIEYFQHITTPSEIVKKQYPAAPNDL